MNLSLFSNPEFGTIRVFAGEKPLFLGREVAIMLGYARPADAVTDHCKGVVVLPTPSAGGMQMMKWISEPDLYRLIMRSKLPAAEQFQDWVCEEVLPAIRSTGSYSFIEADVEPAPRYTNNPLEQLASKIEPLQVVNAETAKAMVILLELQAKYSGVALPSADAVYTDTPRVDPVGEDLRALVQAIVAESEADAIILPLPKILQIVREMRLLHWIFPRPDGPYDWQMDRSTQSRFGKYCRKHLVGREFKTKRGPVQVVRSESSRCTTLAFIFTESEAA